ncbi:MAG: peptidoglycan DD-metalloendopeptidase family protein, partial [Pseudomonadota bacterium]
MSKTIATPPAQADDAQGLVDNPPATAGGKRSGYRNRLLSAFLLVTVAGTAIGGSYSLYSQHMQLQSELAKVSVYKIEAERAKQQALALERELAELRVTFEQEHRQQIDTIARLNRLYESLRRELGIQEARLIEASSSQLEAEQQRTELNNQLLARDERITQLLEEKAAKIQELIVADAELTFVGEERDAALALGERLERELIAMEIRLRETEAQRKSVEIAFRSWVEQQIETIETTLLANGVDADKLMDRALSDSGFGQGGPELLTEVEAEYPMTSAATDSLDDIVGKLQAAQRLVVTAPLLPPIDTYRLTSSYGDRRDPISGRRAFHSGMDIAAPKGTEVLATAGGVVIWAARRGAYGNMVEIDHGMGMTTRYAHLKSMLV